MKGKVGFYINHGVEVRYFLLSGIIDLIRQDFDVCLYTNDIHSKILDAYALKFNVEIKILPITGIAKPKFESYLRAFTNSRKRANNISIYNHFGNLPPARFYDFFLKIPLISFCGNYFFRQLSVKYYKNIELISFFRQENIQRLYQLQYDSVLLKIVAVNASLSGADIEVFINTLKTVFIDDFITFKIKKLFAWNDYQMKLFVQANLGIDKFAFLPLGSPYHNFLRKKDEEAQRKVISKYNLDVNRPIIVYSLINEKVFNQEHLIIELIYKYFNENFNKENRPQIVIRRNPFEQISVNIDYLKTLSEIIIADHFWERNEEKEWSIQAEEGELEWRSLLQIASVSMNIPSMATIDSIMCGTPVININFDQSGVFNKKLNYIIESPYLKYFENSNFIFSLNNMKNFSDLISKYLFVKVNSNYQEILHSIDIAKSFDIDYI